MCGRYTLNSDPQQIVAEYEVTAVALRDGIIAPLSSSVEKTTELARETLRENYNVAPTTYIPAVVNLEGQNTLATFSWGLVPSWSKDPAMGTRMINARVETILEKPSYRSAVKSRHCIIPANGWYEWEKVGAKKVPHYFSSPEHALLSFAGLYEKWVAPDGFELWSTTIITTQARQDIAGIHERMPLLINDYMKDIWLRGDGTAVAKLLDQDENATPIVQWEVSGQVGNVRNNGAGLIEPESGLF
jgi:putative SOS response-associated peptidase YedK